MLNFNSDTDGEQGHDQDNGTRDLGSLNFDRCAACVCLIVWFIKFAAITALET